MKVVAKHLLLVTPLALLFFLTACSSQSAQAPALYWTVSSMVVNLAGNSGGFILQDNGGDNLIVNSNGGFQFATRMKEGSQYNVTVFAQPTNPAQMCGVNSGSGTVLGPVSGITVDCSHNEWTWEAGGKTANNIGTYGTLGTSGANNTPGGRQYPATWTDSAGNLWLFGGYGYDSQGNLLPFNDLWEFGPLGQWTWIGGPSLAGGNGSYGALGVPAASNIPGARFEAASWTDSSGNFWLFGGNGFDSVGNETCMNDVWKYSGGQWTWMGGSNVGMQQSSYGTLGQPAASNTPGGRCSAVTWADASGDIWMFGGLGYDESNPIIGELNDLWKYSGGQWTWMGGPKVKDQPGVYGTKDLPGANNLPGARLGAFGWTDASGDSWVFGGYGYDSNGKLFALNDQWKYSAGEWTWVAGPNVVNQSGVYGTKGVASTNNIPGARQDGVTWTDPSGNAWLWGGNGYDSVGGGGWLNDLWKFSGGQWTWMSGSNLANQNSVYGTLALPGLGNAPGGRFFLTRWSDPRGTLWLFGGYGESTTGLGNLNDLWMFEP